MKKRERGKFMGFWVSEEEKQALEELAYREDLPISAFLRRLIKDLSERKPLPSSSHLEAK